MENKIKLAIVGLVFLIFGSVSVLEWFFYIYFNDLVDLRKVILLFSISLLIISGYITGRLKGVQE